MPNEDYWESAYKSGEYKHWEYSYPSPELVALAAANVPKRNARVLDVGSGGGIDASFHGSMRIQSHRRRYQRSRSKNRKKKSKKSPCGSGLAQRNRSGAAHRQAKPIDFITDRGLFHLIEDMTEPDMLRRFFAY